jgi:hypothetical protein
MLKFLVILNNVLIAPHFTTISESYTNSNTYIYLFIYIYIKIIYTFSSIYTCNKSVDIELHIFSNTSYAIILLISTSGSWHITRALSNIGPFIRSFRISAKDPIILQAIYLDAAGYVNSLRDSVRICISL